MATLSANVPTIASSTCRHEGNPVVLFIMSPPLRLRAPQYPELVRFGLVSCAAKLQMREPTLLSYSFGPRMALSRPPKRT